MAERSIPVDVLNPGQVLACMGFLEAADVLLGDAEGGFEWERAPESFTLRASGERNPVEVVLEFLAEARIEAVAPNGWAAPAKKRARQLKGKENTSAAGTDGEVGSKPTPVSGALAHSDTFPCPPIDAKELKLPMRLPVQLSRGGVTISVSHWADGSSRNAFKLYAGNRSAFDVAEKMLAGVRAPGKRGKNGEFDNLGIVQLWRTRRDQLVSSPFEVLTPLGGRFNFDANGAWTALDSGYSLDEQEHDITASPVVEILGALGLEHARLNEIKGRRVRYAVWRGLLPPPLARVAIAGNAGLAELCRFHFDLDMAGKNKVVTFAQKESSS